MKKMNYTLGNASALLLNITLSGALLIGCASNETSMPTQPAPPIINKSSTTQSPKPAGTVQNSGVQIDAVQSGSTVAQGTVQGTGQNTTQSTVQNKPATEPPLKPGGYYLDDGPGDNPPLDIDKIPDAIPKQEPLLARANKPYKALGATYTPMTSYQPYTATGVASWYGKRYHGRKTSSGEVYDMYAMTAAHPTLPLPSYVQVNNPANGRSIIVRVNDRGPFKKDRLIDLSYAAAFKLRFTTNGSSTVTVRAINANNFIRQSQSQLQPGAAKIKQDSSPINQVDLANQQVNEQVNEQANEQAIKTESAHGYFVQAGAFKNAINADALLEKIQGLNISRNAIINSVYNNGLYRVKLGPFENKQKADIVAERINKQLNAAAVTLFQ